MHTAITTMIITTDTAILTVTPMGTAIPTARMIITTTMGTIMTTAIIMITTTTITCITRMARRITARALPACMCPA